MKQGTTVIVERIRNGNRSARTKITRKHFADLFADLTTYGNDRLLDAIGEELTTSSRRRSAREKSEFEVLVDTLKARANLKTSGVLDLMYAELEKELGDDMPAKSRVRSMPKFLEHFEPKLGEQKLNKVLLAVSKRQYAAH